MMIESQRKNAMSTAESAEAVNDAFAKLAGASTQHKTVATGVIKHDDPVWVMPSAKTYGDGAELYAKLADEEKQVEPFVKRFNYKPWDVALAVHRVWLAGYGHQPTSLRGQTTQIELPISPTETTTVPFGTFDAHELKGKLVMDTAGDASFGMIGEVTFVVPKMMHEVAKGICVAIEKDLEANSIYKGKAITSETMPRFLDPYVTDRDKIVWSRHVDASMRGSLLNVIGYTDRARERGQQIHRSVLMHGEPGNGKSESINIVAQWCMENGWSYVLATSGLREAMQTARLLAPAVVAIEDIERLVAEADPEERSLLLEELDGTTSKGRDIMLVATTNYIGDLEKAVRRRMFKEIEFAGFDVSGAERFLRITLEKQSAPDAGNTVIGTNEQALEYTETERTTLDYARVAQAMDGWGNSYISKVTSFAAGLALEHQDPALTTADLLDAVEAQRPDWEGYLAAQSRPVPNRFDSAFKDLVTTTLRDGVALDDPRGQLEFVVKN